MLPKGIVPGLFKCGHTIQRWTFSLRGTNPSTYAWKRSPSDETGERNSDWDRAQAVPQGIVAGLFKRGNPGIAVLSRQLLGVYQNSLSRSRIASQCYATFKRRRQGLGLRVVPRWVVPGIVRERGVYFLQGSRLEVSG